MKTFVFHLLTLFVFVGCLPNKSNLQISMPKKGTTVSSTVSSASVSSVQIINNQLVINGNGFGEVTNVVVNGNSLNENFSIEEKSANKIIANSIRAFSFDVSKVFSLILSDANASATFSIDFSLCNATLNGKGFNCAAPVADKDVLAYDAISGKWKPRPASGLNYLGTFNASTNPATGPATQLAGAYYVISNSGTIASTPFATGDWLVSNGSSWQKIDNSTAVLSVFGRNGAITAQNGDYNLSMLGDIDFGVLPVAGKVLKFNGTHWVASDDLSGGGAGSVTTAAIAAGAVTDAKIDTVSASKITGTITSSQITDGTIVNADINAAAAIDYSKLNIPNTTIPYAKLNIADGAIPAAKIAGIPAVTTVLTATIANGDTTHAPTSDAVYDALALKIGTNGGVLTSGTISGLPDPVGPTEVANMNYVDTQDSLKLAKAGGTMSGALSLDNDLKILGGVNYVTIKGSGASATYDFTLPVDGGTSGYVLSTNGSGVTSWTDMGSANLWTKTVNDIAYSAGNVSIDKKLRLKSDNANYVEILSPTALASTYTLTLPANDGDADQVLKTNGTGTLSWADITDTGVQAFAKAALPICGGTQVLKSDGTSFSCVTDTSVPAFTGTANMAVATTGVGGTLAVQAVTSTELGYLSGVSSAIQTQLDAKENSLVTGGTTAQYFRGDKTLATLNTANVPELTNLYFTDERAIASPLTGVTSAAGTITAADTIVGAFGKLLNTQTDYVSKTANSTITGTMTINSIVGALKVPTPVNVDDAVPKSYVDGFGQWTQNASDIYRLGGNVGIGTTTPNSKLHVVGGGIEIDNANAIYSYGSGMDSLSTDSKYVMYYTSASNGALFLTGGKGAFADTQNDINFGKWNGTLTKLMTIQASTGNVGIGTTSPATALDVNGVVSKTGTISKTTTYSLPSATPVTLTLPHGGTSLVNGYAYKFNLVTQATATPTGASYIVYQTATGVWASKLVSANGITANHPVLQISGVTVQISQNHASTYPVGVLGEAIVTGNTTIVSPTFFGLEGAMTNLAGNIGIGTATPAYQIDIQNQNSDAGVRTTAFTTAISSGGTFVGGRARGTAAAPTHPLAGDLIAQFLGKNAIINSSNPGMVIWAGENHTNTAIGDYITFYTTGNLTSTSTEKMRIAGNGDVGIGGTPDAKFYVNNGSAIGRFTTGGWTVTSDSRLKHDIHTINNATEKILKLRGVNYIFNNDLTNERQIGFIAQEVEPLFPEVVKTDQTGYKSMVYSNLVAPLVEAFKDLYKKVTDIFMTTEKNTRAIASVNLKVKKLEEENAAKSKEITELKAYLCAKDPRAPICK